MTEKRKLSLDEQLKILEQGGGYMTYPPSPNIEPRVVGSMDPRTSSVFPSSPKPIVPASDAPDSGTSVGRGNPSERSGGSFMLPRPSGTQLPQVSQTSGSNMPGSGIRQLPSVLDQQPQTVPIPPVESEVRIVVPENGEDPFFEQAGTHPRGNPYGPLGRISPRTAAGNDADPLPEEPMPAQTSVVKQIQHPTSPPGPSQKTEPLKENPSYLAPSSYKGIAGRGGTIE
jgi:hypothetical protein